VRFFAAIGIVVVIVIGILIGVATLGRITDTTNTTSRASSTPAAEAVSEHVIPVSPGAYWAQYHRNEVKADSIYRDQTIRMTSMVESINKDFTDSVYLVFPVGDSLLGIQAHMQASEMERAGSLSKGDLVTVLCKGGQMVIGTPMLKECVFSEEPAPFPVVPQRQAAPAVSEDSQTFPGSTAVYHPPADQPAAPVYQAPAPTASQDEYEDGFLATMKSHWKVPLGTPPGTSAGIVVYISANGTVASRVETPSGNPALDQSCPDAIMRIGRYGPTPGGNTVTISFDCKVNQ
jgi:hypothetical protein